MEQSMEKSERHLRGEEFLSDFEDSVIGRITSRFWGRVFTLIIASLGLVTALAWDEALRDIFKKLFKINDTVWASLLYAVIVTVIAVVITMGIAKRERKHRK